MELHGIVTLPVIPLRGIAVLPGEIMHCDIGRKKTLSAMEQALSDEGYAFFVAQKNAKVVDVTPDDLYSVGTICRIRQVFRIQNDTVHLLVTGVVRARVENIISENPHYTAQVQVLEAEEPDEATVEALRRRLSEGFTEHANQRDRLTQDQKDAILALPTLAELTDAIAQQVVGKLEDKQKLIETDDLVTRSATLLGVIENELLIMQVDRRIAGKIKAALERNQKEFVLREQLKAVQEELGEGDDEVVEGYRERALVKKLPDEVRAALDRQIDRFASLPGGSHEAPMAQAYIELILDLPWMEATEDNLDLKHARAVLDRDHYGMERVKSRIIESLAVQRLTNNPQGQILCLVGPPGVGKTSIVRGIAEAMGRKFVRMSLGGVHDEAEIRGHRRTYIGAQPGRVIEAVRKAGSINPVLLFDEIDKLGADVRGDPSSAMLEVLDSAQNNAFIDHFLELPFDLSRCMLITTANDAGAIPQPLRDRMELIEVPSYLFYEKEEIAKRHLLPKQMEKNGLKKSNLRVSEGALQTLIGCYTREAGVRELERVLASVCRKAACEIADGKTRITLTDGRITDWLGPRKFRRNEPLRPDTVGVVTGLAWTSVGGETLEVEAAAVPGKGVLQLTGHLGDVMQESAKAAMTYVRANANRFGIDPSFLETLDVHIHVPEGAVPKDGPSAGVSMATALVSALTGIPVKSSVAMTGEVTLRGRVLPIGGLREKLLAAVRAGIERVVLPKDNREDLYDVPAEVKAALKIDFAETVDEVLGVALTMHPHGTEPLINLPGMDMTHEAVRH
ncbi:MAG TPA: endopeptidase La [Eubacteriales bacterium]|nr:endopeptidase La [Eubacteriales bacterium]